MPRITTSLRRRVGVALAGCIAATGLSLAVPVAAAHAVTPACQMTFSPASIRPGETTTLTITGDPDVTNYSGMMTVGGHLIENPGPWLLPGNGSSEWSYDLLQILGGATAPSVGFRVFPYPTPSVSESSTPLCSGEVQLVPALQNQAITFPGIQDTALSVHTVTLNASADSALPVAYSSQTTGVCTVSGSVVTLVSQGKCTVSASQDGNGVYAAALPVSNSFWVQLPPAFTFAPIADQLLSKGSMKLSAVSPSDGFIEYSVADSSVCSVPVYARRPAGTVRPARSIDTDELTFHKLGTCTVTAKQYQYMGWTGAGPVTRSFKIVDATPALALQVPDGVALSRGKAAISATASAKVTSSTPSVCTIASATSVKLVAAGACKVTAKLAGATPVSRSFPVWGAPAIPAAGKTTQTVSVLGKGESHLHVTAKPVGVCGASDGEVTLIAPGSCKVRVADHGTTVRSGTIEVAFVKSAKPSQQLKHGGKVLFAFNSAKLTSAAKHALHAHLATLRTASTVVVYGNTYGPGKNSAHSRKLAADRAHAVVRYLRAHGVKAKAVTVAAAMQNPVSKDPAKNRRADVYYTE
ncbi:OmpA family protein [Nocardioides sp. BP30]|uniref:OmpA family protein n=1 Tax=Nocardioides sp. BP30 TaxID=3036374 RepID=UPI0024691D56|nr:OmpA family protein [Nocardioides sp. BP30]WGL51463.1 OmpA family protein [Nocardioides sp. BP30]